jgi:hypothetical protein
MVTVFMALVLFVLVWNAALLWFIHLQLKQSAGQAEQVAPAVGTFLGDLRNDLGRLEAASARATEWSAAARERVKMLEGDFDRADNWMRYGLANVDFEVNKVSERLDEETQRVKTAIEEPLFQTATVVQGVHALLELALAIRQRAVPRRRAKSRGSNPSANS